VHRDYILRQKAVKFNKTKRYKQIFKKRACVELINAGAKRFHGMFRAKLRRLWKIRIQVYLTAIAINLKRMARFFIAPSRVEAAALSAGP
jgi:IS5 family transposase